MHVSDSELLQWADDELPPQRTIEVREHVEGCWQCLARQGELLAASADFADARRVELPPLGDSAARLRARMELLEMPRPRVARESAWPTLALVAAVALCGAWWVTRSSDRLTPDARLTPGATLALSREQVCAVPEAEEARIIPASLAGQVFNSYGIRPTPRSYEVDYLIAPELGGATDVKNLWPQPYAAGVWNARVKDALENHLRQLVCDGTVDLPTAQREIATDWIGAYRKYFRTDQPLAAHATYLKDHPWE
jgi:hypothetical protein